MGGDQPPHAVPPKEHGHGQLLAYVLVACRHRSNNLLKVIDLQIPMQKTQPVKE